MKIVVYRFRVPEFILKMQRYILNEQQKVKYAGNCTKKKRDKAEINVS